MKKTKDNSIIDMNNLQMHFIYALGTTHTRIISDNRPIEIR